MRNKYVRQKARDARVAISREGLSYRRIEHGEKVGQVARLRIGVDATAQVVTLEQQPGHEPVAFVQSLRYNSRAPWAYRYKPVGNQVPIDGAQVWEMLDTAISERVIPVGAAHLEKAALFFPKPENIEQPPSLPL